MKQFETKIKLVYFPFLVITVLYILAYTFLNWLIVIQTNLAFTVNEMIPNFALPFVFCWIPILIWLRKPTRLFVVKKNADSFGLQMFACLAMAAPTIVAQVYMSAAMGKITNLENVSQIEKSAPTKYYTLKQSYIDKNRIGVYTKTAVSGKHSEHYDMDIYIAMPIFNAPADTINTDCGFWIGKNYSNQISNSSSSQEKDDKFKSFAEASQKEFDEMNFSDFVYLERVNKDMDEYQKAAKESDLGKEKAPVVFKEIYEPFEKRTGDTFEWIFISFGIGAFVWLLMISFRALDEAKVEAFKNGIEDKEAKNEAKETIDVILPHKGYVFTPILMYLNIFIFIVMVCFGLGFISFESADLLKWGADFRPYTTNGQWWRLLTSTFLHGGIMHLVGNMVGLLFVGIFLERIIGSARFISVYLITGIIASCVSLWWHNATVSVGASGAIFGLYGCFLALMLLKVLPPKLSKAFLVSAAVFVGYNLLMGLTGNTDNAAHVGGLVSGFIIGIILTPQIKKRLKDDPIANDPAFAAIDEAVEEPAENTRDTDLSKHENSTF